MLTLSLIIALAGAPAGATSAPSNVPLHCVEAVAPHVLGAAVGWIRLQGDEPWQYDADELRRRDLLGCIAKSFLVYPVQGDGAVSKAEYDAGQEIIAVARALGSEYNIEVIIDGVDDVVPFASRRYNSEDGYAEAAERHERRASQRAATLARHLRKLVPANVAVELGDTRVKEAKGRRGVLVFVRYTRRANPTAGEPPRSNTPEGHQVEDLRNTVPPDDPPARLPTPPDELAPAVHGRWMFSPYVRAFFIFGHGSSYVWDKGGEVAAGFLLSRHMKRWALEFGSEFRYASIHKQLKLALSEDPLLAEHFLFPVMLGVFHRGVIAGAEIAAGYLDERLHPEIPARPTRRRLSLTTGIYAGIRLPIPKSSGPWVELAYSFSWAIAPMFPSYDQGLGHVHAVSTRIGWGFSRRRRAR